MRTRVVRHFSTGHNPRREIDEISELLDRNGVPRMCADETAEMSVADRVRSLLVMLRHARGDIGDLREQLSQPVDVADVQFRA